MYEDITRDVLRNAGIETSDAAFKAFWEGRARIVLIPDEYTSFDDLCGDCYNPAANPDIPKSRLSREKSQFRKRVENEGVFGSVLERFNSDADEWEEDFDYSIWGFVGRDFIGSGYDSEYIDAMREV